MSCVLVVVSTIIIGSVPLYMCLNGESWLQSWLQEFGAAFVYALDRHSHGGSLSVLGHLLVESWLQEFGAAFVYALDRHSHG